MVTGARIVLFGKSGFVGSNILKELGADVFAPSELDVDLTNPDTLQGVINAGDVVINAAGYASATDRTPKGLELFQRVNLDGLRNLADACVNAGAAQLIHISSVAAMGMWDGEDITESMMRPVKSPYAASKLEGERLLAQYSDKLSITILRPTSVFGEGRGMAASLCSLVAKGKVPLPGGGEAKIPFTFIGNITHAVRLTVGNERCFGKTFIIGDLISYPLKDVVSALAQGMGISIKIVPIPVRAAYCAALLCEAAARLRKSSPLLDRGRLHTMTESVCYDIDAFVEATGYSPPYDLQASAARIAQWYLSHNPSQKD
ncbi:MAG: NAD(P)-dependent oxidoreductase [Armatimonadetes bacterium]|nr:NAD(P)-dependent oxidoreductase [Armatimonadota bacterium]